MQITMNQDLVLRMITPERSLCKSRYLWHACK